MHRNSQRMFEFYCPPHKALVRSIMDRIYRQIDDSCVFTVLCSYTMWVRGVFPLPLPGPKD